VPDGSEEAFRPLDFNDEIATHEQIDSIAAIEQDIFVTNRQWHLHLKWNASMRKLAGQALTIGRFE
jgi:hypothetical protein